MPLWYQSRIDGLLLPLIANLPSHMDEGTAKAYEDKISHLLDQKPLPFYERQFLIEMALLHHWYVEIIVKILLADSSIF